VRGFFGFGGKNKNGNPLDALGTGVLRYSKTGTFPEKKRRRTEMTNSKFQAIKANIIQGRNCAECVGPVSLDAGKKNIIIRTCDHAAAGIFATLAALEITVADVRTWNHVSAEDVASRAWEGAWNGCAITVRRDEVSK
jgi:hypothetical protein